MSLILDALRKADAERERGSVPSLHSQPVVLPSVGTLSTPKVRPNWPWIAIGVALGLVAAATWVMLGRNAPAPSAATTNRGARAAEHARGHFGAAGRGERPPPRAAAATDTQTIAEPAPWRQPEELKAPRADAKGNTQVVTLGNVPPAAGARLLTRTAAAGHPRSIAAIRDRRQCLFAGSDRALADRQRPAVPGKGPPDAGALAGGDQAEIRDLQRPRLSLRGPVLASASRRWRHLSR